MLSYFKANDPYRLLGVFLILIIIRVAVLLSGVPLILPELKWLLLGERLGGEGMIMYRDVWDYTAPLSVLVYKWLDILFGKHQLVYQIVSMILVGFQAAIFNNVMLKNKAYNSPSYVPAIVYVLMMNLCFDFLTLSPVLMSMTFILLALNNLFKRMDNHTQDELFVYTGIYLGIAVLFYLPAIFYVLVTLISLFLYTGSIFRRILLLIVGFLLVLIFSGLFFYWNDSFLVYNHHLFMSIWAVDPSYFLSGKGMVIMVLVPFSIFLYSIYRTFKIGKYVNFQSKIQSVMLMFFVSGILAFFMVKERSTYQFIYLVPVMAFFVAHHLLVIKNWILAEATFLLIFVAIILNLLFPLRGWLFVDQLVGVERLLVQPSPYAELTEGKDILVIGEGIEHYKGASLATPYLDWQLSQIHLQHLNYFDNSAEVFLNFTSDMPEVIIDEQEVVPELFRMMPTIAAQYREHVTYAGVYVLMD
ncbi:MULTISPECIES: hypothetical protein [Reichenbachiella]|uniref:hypothetical protein n=1 Tax=Reichenbachiella TaxID=156993 RepID=UPI000E6C49E5|nr:MULTISPECIES: hypothetical protein [Reichenbachiella]MBU2914286.1 hypothetical protein [Reichenbachiella agariperforans]RJE73013.1 hypothetical protein BGP76_03450 [Reichenbachiella sp. MSK19-1]